MKNGVTPLVARDVHREYLGGAGKVLHILRGADVTVSGGEAVAIVGASGSGKSTLLHILGALDRPTSGSVKVGGVDVADLSEEEAADLRNRQVGFVFQFHHLLREFTALENVIMPALIRGDGFDEAQGRGRALLEQIGLGDRLEHKPGELSGGEQQRVAVARALVNDPLVILADEPTGNLDAKTSAGVQEAIFGLLDRHRVAMVVVTHSRELAARAHRVLKLTEGVLEDA
ncbi:MAG: ABC transporter ATP-binding protein [Gemmatimonadetes bacterium]|nr:ABC transporter ATP-binding protein [Gemmatimonadota bacterium]